MIKRRSKLFLDTKVNKKSFIILVIVYEGREMRTFYETQINNLLDYGFLLVVGNVVNRAGRRKNQDRKTG